MRIRLVSLMFVAGLWPAAVPAAATSDALLAKADAIRNPQLDYRVSVRVTSYKANAKPTEASYRALIKGRDRSVILTEAPAIDRGRSLLMSGHNFWAFMPNVSKPLRISLQERLTGEVANGDLARANFTGDYDIVDSQRGKAGAVDCVVLDLKAKTSEVTYGRVQLWVDAKTTRPVQAAFYAASGRLLKKCRYENYQPIGGAVRPTRIVMTDAVVPDRYSVLEYADMEVRPIPDKVFSKDYMKRLDEGAL